MPFNKNAVKTSWEKSDVRKWLNSSFKSKAFIENEIKAIIPIKHEGVTDTVSLLSLNETKSVFDEKRNYSSSSKKELNKYSVAPYTTYAIKEQSGILSAMSEAAGKENMKEIDWWTCSIDNTEPNKAYHIHGSLSFFTAYTDFIDRKTIGVRPVIQIDLSKAEYTILE